MSPTIESLLAADLRKLASLPSPGPDLDAITRRGRVLRRRRIALAGAGGSAVAAGAAAIALAVGTAGPGAPAGVAAHGGAVAAGTPPAGGPRAGAPSATQLRAQLTAAFAKAKATSKVTVVTTFAGKDGTRGKSATITVPSQDWQETINWSSAGVTQEVDFSAELPGVKRLTMTGYDANNQKVTFKNRLWREFRELRIDYATHRYYTDTWYAAANVSSSQFFTVPQPESVQTSSWSRLTGTATVDGQPAYVLAQTGSGGVTATTWVNQRTLLPVRDVVHTYVGTSTDDYTWSTADGAGATAAANTPAIPHGFVNGGAAPSGALAQPVSG